MGVDRYEYMVVYHTQQGQQAGIYKEMNKAQLDKLLQQLEEEGCVINSVEIIRRSFFVNSH